MYSGWISAKLGPATELTNGCVVGAMCEVTSPEIIPENTVIYGESCERRIQHERPTVRSVMTRKNSLENRLLFDPLFFCFFFFSRRHYNWSFWPKSFPITIISKSHPKLPWLEREWEGGTFFVNGHQMAIGKKASSVAKQLFGCIWSTVFILVVKHELLTEHHQTILLDTALWVAHRQRYCQKS